MMDVPRSHGVRMPNDRLRDALLTKGLTPNGVAEQLSVDPEDRRTVDHQGRIPYARHRHALAADGGQESETYLWPGAFPPRRRGEVSGSEIVQVYAHRSIRSR